MQILEMTADSVWSPSLNFSVHEPLRVSSFLRSSFEFSQDQTHDSHTIKKDEIYFLYFCST